MYKHPVYKCYKSFNNFTHSWIYLSMKLFSIVCRLWSSLKLQFDPGPSIVAGSCSLHRMSSMFCKDSSCSSGYCQYYLCAQCIQHILHHIQLHWFSQSFDRFVLNFTARNWLTCNQSLLSSPFSQMNVCINSSIGCCSTGILGSTDFRIYVPIVSHTFWQFNWFLQQPWQWLKVRTLSWWPTPVLRTLSSYCDGCRNQLNCHNPEYVEQWEHKVLKSVTNMPVEQHLIEESADIHLTYGDDNSDSLQVNQLVALKFKTKRSKLCYFPKIRELSWMWWSMCWIHWAQR